MSPGSPLAGSPPTADADVRQLILERIEHIVEQLIEIQVLCDQLLARKADANAEPTV
jgi:hypothetical protein